MKRYLVSFGVIAFLMAFICCAGPQVLMAAANPDPKAIDSEPILKKKPKKSDPKGIDSEPILKKKKPPKKSNPKGIDSEPILKKK